MLNVMLENERIHVAKQVFQLWIYIAQLLFSINIQNTSELKNLFEITSCNDVIVFIQLL